MESASAAWHIRRMNGEPYSVEIVPEPGGSRWKLREHGKLIERSHRLYDSAGRAQEAGLEKIQKMKHGNARERGR